MTGPNSDEGKPEMAPKVFSSAAMLPRIPRVWKNGQSPRIAI